jgi:hypothetical protein
MAFFTHATEQTQYILDQLNATFVPTTFKRGYYGDQEMIPHFPAFIVESNDKDRVLGGQSSTHKFRLALRTVIIIYHEKIQASSLTKKEDEVLAEAVEDYFLAHPDLDQHVIFGYVERVRPGVVIRPGRVMLKATRLEYIGISQETF